MAFDIIYSDIEVTEGSKDLLGGRARRVTKIGRFADAQFGANLKSFCEQMGSALDGASTSVPTYELTSFTVSLDVTAAGEIRLIGSVSTEITGGVTLVFSKRDPA